MDTGYSIRPRTWWSALLDVLGTSKKERGVRISSAAEAGRWHWLYADVFGVAVPGPRASFRSQEVAEDWVDFNAGSLRALGVSAVTLLDGERAIYGPARLGS